MRRKKGGRERECMKWTGLNGGSITHSNQQPATSEDEDEHEHEVAPPYSSTCDAQIVNGIEMESCSALGSAQLSLDQSITAQRSARIADSRSGVAVRDGK